MAAYTTIDKIVKSLLLQRELPMHWYFPWLKLATDCYRELLFDTLGISQEKLVTATGGKISFPCDFVDYVTVWASGDDKKCPIPVIEVNRAKEYLVIGWRSGVAADGEYVLDYINNGNSCDAATKVHPYAQNTIEKYVIWKNSPNRDNERSPEGNAFSEAHKDLRSRINELTPEIMDVITSRRTHISASLKDWTNNHG